MHFLSRHLLDSIKGKVKSFNFKKGFGFIVPEDGKQVYVHYSDIVSTGNFKSLRPKMEVAFNLKEVNGKQRATDVTNADGTPIVPRIRVKKGDVLE